MMPRRKPKESQRDYSRRAVYVDHLGRFAWYVDSLGRKSPIEMIPDGEDPMIVVTDLQNELDAHDAIPADEFVPDDLRHLRLLP
jgi:hypothetical protein